MPYRCEGSPCVHEAGRGGGGEQYLVMIWGVCGWFETAEAEVENTAEPNSDV